MVRLQVTLTPDEAQALSEWASQELRDPREQLRQILRLALSERATTSIPEKHRSEEQKHV